MKNFTMKSAIILLLSVLGLRFSAAKNPEYKLTTGNLNQAAANVIEFDIYLHHTNPEETNFEYILGQYFFEFNPEIANGGTLNYSIVKSDLPQSLQPRNPSVAGNLLRLASNSVPAKENLPLISDKSQGTLVARMRLETSAKEFSQAGLDLKLKTDPENPYTKVCAYINNQITDITNREEVASDNISVMTGNSEIPKEFALMQNYPNPFNPATNIKFDIPLLSNIKVTIYDIAGKEISVLVNRQLQPGSYSYTFNGSNFASGIYFYSIKAGSPSENQQHILQTKRMMLIK